MFHLLFGNKYLFGIIFYKFDLFNLNNKSMINYIYCREYGLQAAIPNLTFGLSEANGNPPVIINQSIKPTKQIIGRGGIELVQVERVLYKKVITLSNFNGYDNLYIGKKSNFYFQNVAFDFTNDKWKVRDLTGHPLNNTKFNVYDRPKIKSILSTFLSKRQEDVFNLMYTEIAKADGLKKFLNILESVIELQDHFFDVLVPYEDTYLPVPDGLENKGNGLKVGDTDGGNSSTKTNTTIKYAVGASLLAFGLYRMKKKKVF